MLSAGDTISRTQGGNNNAYCQDNEISWLDWELDDSKKELLAFARRLAKLRTGHPVFRRRHFFQGRRIRGSELEDLMWFRPDGETLTESDWNAASTRAFAMRLGGDAMLEWDEQGRRVVDATLLLLFNASPDAVEFVVPRSAPEVVWRLVLSTSHPELEAGAFHVNGGEQIHTEGRSVLVLERVEGKE
jgi:glycogen operon protein